MAVQMNERQKNDLDLIENTLSLFSGRCGHRWVGATGGNFGCPLCGDRDGDHHLHSAEPIAVQPEDWGCAWEALLALSTKVGSAA